MIKIHVERRQSKQLFWCQACGSKQSRTVTISSNDNGYCEKVYTAEDAEFARVQIEHLLKSCQ